MHVEKVSIMNEDDMQLPGLQPGPFTPLFVLCSNFICVLKYRMYNTLYISQTDVTPFVMHLAVQLAIKLE